MDPLSTYLMKQAGNNYKYPVILMYHATVPGSATQSFKYAIDSHRFTRHLNLLESHGWHTACVKDLKDLSSLPDKTIFLTFDDGFANNFEGAFLQLTQRNMRATFYIVTSCIGLKSTWLKNTGNEIMLTSDQIFEMHSKGMEIGSHTDQHADLGTLNPEDTLSQLVLSKKKLEDIVESPIETIAYPFGRFTDETVDCAKKAGYRFACSVRSGWIRPGFDPYRLPRITIFASDSIAAFARKIAFASNDVSWKYMFDYYKQRLLEKF